MSTARISRIRCGICLTSLGIAAGVATSRADTFNIEIDYMVKTGTDADSHVPNPAEVDAVVQMFACQGHTLNVVVDDALPDYNVMPRDPANCGSFFSYSGTTSSFGYLKSQHYDHDGVAGWHYCIFGHQYAGADCLATGSSGLGELLGDDFVVTLGTFDGMIGTPWDRAATLAHEFGHNLGLSHCGDMNCNDPDAVDYVGPFVPNLPSIMSYYYQLRGVRSNMVCQGLAHDISNRFKELDYSGGTMCTLNEDALSETYGTGMIGVDWDCSGSIEGTVMQDINTTGSWCSVANNRTYLYDFNEWTAIQNTTFTENRASLENLPEIFCVTSEEMRDYDESTRAFCPKPAVVSEPCETARMVYVVPINLGLESGQCVKPYDHVQFAHDLAPDDSVIFLEAGTYYEAGTVFDRPMEFLATGAAVLR